MFPAGDATKKRPELGAEGRLEVAAVVETRTHAAGMGWRLTLGPTPGAVRALTRHRSSSRIALELEALRRGLAEASRKGVRTLVLRIPDSRARTVLRGVPTSSFRRARIQVDRCRPLLERFAGWRLETSFAPDPELAHAVGEALDAGLHLAAEREEHRVMVMERIVERAKEVSVERTDSGWLANGRYRVQLEPMRCECPAWTARWARAPIAARRAERLPCKHLVALALHEGISVPADLARLARRAPT